MKLRLLPAALIASALSVAAISSAGPWKGPQDETRLVSRDQERGIAPVQQK